MTIYRNINWKKRDYECTNVVAIRTAAAMDATIWQPADESALHGLSRLWIEHRNGQEYEVWGYL